MESLGTGAQKGEWRFLPFYPFTFLPFRKEAEELGINLIDDVTKLLGVVLEVEIVYFHNEQRLSGSPTVRTIDS